MTIDVTPLGDDEVREPLQQKELLELVEWDWLVILDGCRADTFEQHMEGFLEWVEDDLDVTLEPKYTRADNGGIAFTKTWFQAMFPEKYDLACFNPQPIHSFGGGAGEYDERLRFEAVPGMMEYEWVEDLATAPPEAVSDVVFAYVVEDRMEQRLEDLGYTEDAEDAAIDAGVIRYLQPHPPLRGLVELTKGRGNRVKKVAQAVRSGDLTLEDLEANYEDNLEWVLEDVVQMLEWLPGTIVITADHGECLGDCGQYFHGGGHDKHDHLREVPWLVL